MSASTSSLPASGNKPITPLFPEFPGIQHPWVFCFFKPGENGTFRCILTSHQSKQNYSVIFCNDGHHLYYGLLRHLRHHGINAKNGKVYQKFTDPKDRETTIDLTTIVSV